MRWDCISPCSQGSRVRRQWSASHKQCHQDRKSLGQERHSAGDLLVLIAHSVLANANLGKYKVDACEGLLRVGRIAEGYLWSILPDVDGTCLGNCPLTLGIVVIERNPIDGEHITLREVSEQRPAYKCFRLPR